MISNCVVVGNQAGWGAGWTGADLELWNSTVVSNTAVFRGGGIIVDNSLIRNCLVYGNQAGEQAGESLCVTSRWRKTARSTGNRAEEGGGIDMEYATLRNSIVYHNQGVAGANWFETGR